MKERIDTALLGTYAITGGAVVMITMADVNESFAFGCGGFLAAVGVLSFAAVAADIHKARIKARIAQALHDINGYHILKTFRKIYRGL